MSASGLSLFANFRPFFVSHYEGSEELCREIQARYHYYCKPNQCKVTAADCCACLASRSQRHGGNGTHRQLSKWHTEDTAIQKDKAAEYVLHSCRNKMQPFDALQRKEALLYNLHNNIKAEISAAYDFVRVLNKYRRLVEICAGPEDILKV
tara:strand:- start:1365 stop:1817 length:453 start_codon:yes stop_codon:yes gene_type:complete